jgi:hypothetical protein
MRVLRSADATSGSAEPGTKFAGRTRATDGGASSLGAKCLSASAATLAVKRR